MVFMFICCRNFIAFLWDFLLAINFFLNKISVELSVIEAASGRDLVAFHLFKREYEVRNIFLYFIKENLNRQEGKG